MTRQFFFYCGFLPAAGFPMIPIIVSGTKSPKFDNKQDRRYLKIRGADQLITINCSANDFTGKPWKEVNNMKRTIRLILMSVIIVAAVFLSMTSSTRGSALAVIVVPHVGIAHPAIAPPNLGVEHPAIANPIAPAAGLGAPRPAASSSGIGEQVFNPFFNPFFGGENPFFFNEFGAE